MANKKIIELDSASQVNSDALFPLSQLVDSNQKTLKATVAQMQAAMLAPVSGLVTLGESSGSIASFSTDIADKLFSCYVNVTAQQAGSGTPSPSNPRAISGFDSGVVTRCGVNLWNEVWELGAIRGADGTDVEASTQIRSVGYTRVKPNTSYRAVPTSIINVFFYDANKNYIDFISFSALSTFTTPENCYFVRLSTKGGYGTTYNNDISINYPSSDTQYHAYNGNTYAFAFGQTVYGGELDLFSGVLTITHSMVDLGSLTWSKDTTIRPVDGATIHAFYAPLNECKLNFSGVPKMVCSIFTPSTVPKVDYGGQTEVLDNICAGADGNHRIWAYGSTYNNMSTTEFKTAMNGVQLVYELATPTVIQLTPTEVKTILGQNNIFGDCGDIDLKYLETIGNRL